MVAKAKTSELVIRIRSRNGKDELSAEDVHAALCGREPNGKDRWIVQEVEGGSLDKEVLCQVVRDNLQTIYASMGKGIVDFIRDCGKEWDSVKDRVEPILQGKFAQCPQCGCPVLTSTLVDGESYSCIECGSKWKWKSLPNTKRPELSRYVLVPV